MRRVIALVVLTFLCGGLDAQTERSKKTSKVPSPPSPLPTRGTRQHSRPYRNSRAPRR